MNYTLTTTLSSSIYKFLNKEAKSKKTTKKSIIEEALSLYRKIKLEHDIKKGLSERYSEYHDINSDFHEIQTNSIKD